MASGQLSVSDAASRLGVTPQRVRALIASGRLDAERVGRAYLLDPVVVARLRESGRPSGRPLSAAGAWSLLAMLGGHNEDVSVSRASLYRLRAVRKNAPETVGSLLAGSQPRARQERWRVLPGDVVLLRDDPDVVLSGVAADDPLVDVRHQLDRDGLDGYVSESTLARLQQRFQPAVSSNSSNVTLRVPVGADWVLERARAPTAVVAADLLDARDERLRRAGRKTLGRLVDGD